MHCSHLIVPLYPSYACKCRRRLSECRQTRALAHIFVGKNREAHALSCLLEPEKLQLAYKKKFALSHAWRGIVALLHLYAKVILRTSIERCGSCNSSTLFRVRTPSTLSPSLFSSQRLRNSLFRKSLP